MANYPDNSKVKKEVKQITEGAGSTGKAPLVTKDDVNIIKDYVWKDVLKPAAKKTAGDVVSNLVKAFSDTILDGFSMLIFHETGKLKTGPGSQSKLSTWTPWGYSPNYSSASIYNNASQPNVKKQQEALVGQAFRFKPVLLRTFEDSEAVRVEMGNILAEYGKVSIADAYHLAGIPCDFTAQDWGWFDISSAVTVDSGIADYPFMLQLPRPLSLK